MPSSRQQGAREDEDKPAKRKRNRKPVSCAECRRMKLKCDRQVPCSSCSKRGCAALCPNGTLTAGPRNRFVLADTEQLHEKIEMMGQRITELEDALAKLQAQLSDVAHPLLADDLLLIKAPLSTQSAMVTLDEESEEVAKSLGTLTLGDRPRFFGPHAAVDYFLMDYSVDEPPASANSLGSDIQLLDLLQTPPTGVARSQVLIKLAQCLPTAEQAWYIIDRHYSQTSWFFVIISEDELRETIFSRVYGSDGPNLVDVPPHDIAILFMMLAYGHMFDAVHSSNTNHSPDNAAGAKYYHLARIAFALDSVLDHPTIQAIRALVGRRLRDPSRRLMDKQHMMSSFAQMSDIPNSPTTCYLLMGLAARLCQCLGLHRDDTHWDLPDAERQKRRRVFWEVASYDLWTSLAYGRPPSFTMAHVDAKVADEFATALGDRPVSFCSWGHTFACRVLPKVVDQAFGVIPLSYSTVLRLDQLVREHPVHEALRVVDGAEDDPSIPTALLLKRNAVLSLTQRLVLYLHRGFFARALLEHPEDPLKSKYAQSVLAVFRAAVRLNVSIRTLYTRIPRSLGPEFRVFWTPCFSSCLVLSSIAIKSPGSGLAPPALAALDEMFNFLEQVAPMSPRILRLMPKIRNLHAKAHENYAAVIATPGYVPPTCTPRSKVDELGKMFFWGPTHTVDDDSTALPTTPSGHTGVPPAVSACVGSTIALAQPTPADVLGANEPQTLTNTLMGFNSDNSQVPLQTFNDIFDMQPGSWDPGQPGTSHAAPAFAPHTACDSTVPPGLEDLFSGEFPVGASGFDSAMNWLPSEPNAGPGMIPQTDHDLAWQRFVSDIGLFDQDSRTNRQP